MTSFSDHTDHMIVNLFLICTIILEKGPLTFIQSAKMCNNLELFIIYNIICTPSLVIKPSYVSELFSTNTHTWGESVVMIVCAKLCGIMIQTKYMFFCVILINKKQLHEKWMWMCLRENESLSPDMYSTSHCHVSVCSCVLVNDLVNDMNVSVDDLKRKKEQVSITPYRKVHYVTLVFMCF